MAIVAINPATNEIIKEYQEMNPDEVQAIIEKADAAFSDWRRTSFPHRAALMRKAAQILRDKSIEYGRLMAQEMGKPLQQGKGEAEKCAWVCDFYADNAEPFLQEQIVETTATKSFVSFQPLGIVLAAMPWNFPFWQVFRFAAPALMAGNVGLLKHASNVPGCAVAIEEVFRQAGFPEYVFNTLLIGSRQVDAVIEHPLSGR